MFSSCLMGSSELLGFFLRVFGRGWGGTTLIHCGLGSLHREERLWRGITQGFPFNPGDKPSFGPTDL